MVLYAGSRSYQLAVYPQDCKSKQLTSNFLDPVRCAGKSESSQPWLIKSCGLRLPGALLQPFRDQSCDQIAAVRKSMEPYNMMIRSIAAAGSNPS